MKAKAAKPQYGLALFLGSGPKDPKKIACEIPGALFQTMSIILS